MVASVEVARELRAPRPRVFRALLDPVDVAAWRFPAGMTCQIHELDAREGGRIRVSLTYVDQGEGKTSEHTDTYSGRFVTLVPDELVVEEDEFETDDPSLAGVMTMTIRLEDAGGGTLLRATHEGLPPGLDVHDNETGWREALDRLAELVEETPAEGHIELGEGRLLSAPRRITASAQAIFDLLADPRKQAELDGSGMLVGPASDDVITDVGDVFTMRMHNRKHGDYEMNNRVVEFERGRRIAWEPQPGKGHPDHGPGGATWGHRWGFVLEPDGPDATIVRQSYDCSKLPDHERADMDGGRMWLPAMAQTLDRLAELVEAPA